MDALIVRGGTPLEGRVDISGAKNAALPMLACALLGDGPSVFDNVPQLRDIETMRRLLDGLGAQCAQDVDFLSFEVDPRGVNTFVAPYELVRTMRASIVLLGPLLSRFGQARISLPGGCAIGARPVNLHLDALRRMGAQIELEDGYIVARADRLHGADILFDQVTVTGTENILMAASLARGTTRIGNAAREPEVVDLARCLQSMGAQIEGAGTDTILVEGRESLRGVAHRIMPDRIEAGTFMTAAAITGGDIRMEAQVAEHLGSLMAKLGDVGVDFRREGSELRVTRSGEHLEACDVTTSPYPGFPTDMQAQYMALMSLARGTSLIEETIFENRFMHVAELQRMGARIEAQGSQAVVRGVESLHGAPVMATDLRASASLVLAALAASGVTQVQRIYHLDRGYDGLERKLSALGADIERIQA